MLIVTINEIPGKKLEALGVVRGSTVQSRNLGHDMMAGFRTLVGGEVTDYADMLTEARQIATGRMVKDAEALGADAIGMSTVPETIAANYLGLEVLGIACITNMATGIAERKHSHEEVLAVADRASADLCRLVERVIEKL